MQVELPENKTLSVDWLPGTGRGRQAFPHFLGSVISICRLVTDSMQFHVCIDSDDSYKVPCLTTHACGVML